MLNKINKKILFYILVLISLVLVSSFFIEFVLGHKPCKLCIYQRVPYFVSLILLANIFLFQYQEKISLLLLGIIFFLGSILAFYHTGIEQGFFTEFLTCSNTEFSETLTKNEVLEQLNESTISCKDISFEILGFSLATINTIFSIILSVIFIRLFINYGKN
tara:strand:- start:1973 stop:2455 length:483 start_codon:yes stop_codon:yes gene_type:complete